MTGQEDFLIEKNSMQSALDLLTRSANILNRAVVVKKYRDGMRLVKKIKYTIELVRGGDKFGILRHAKVQLINNNAQKIYDVILAYRSEKMSERWIEAMHEIEVLVDAIQNVLSDAYIKNVDHVQPNDIVGVVNNDDILLAQNELQEIIDQARIHLKVVRDDRENIISKINQLEAESDRLENVAEALSESEPRINKILDDAEKALGGATRASLASSFSARANNSLKIGAAWVCVLLLTLYAGVEWGSAQVDHLADLAKANSNTNYFWLRSVLAVMSFAAPVWVAWLATKQLSERFRIAEDYSYKAAVSSAYEGYKKEANAIGKEHEEKLFETALGAVSQHPLRHLNSKIHGSPLHEALDAPAVLEFIKALPKMIGDAKDGSIGKKSGENKKDEGEAEEKKEK